jgi:hypothetical protein
LFYLELVSAFLAQTFAPVFLQHVVVAAAAVPLVAAFFLQQDFLAQDFFVSVFATSVVAVVWAEAPIAINATSPNDKINFFMYNVLY